MKRRTFLATFGTFTSIAMAGCVAQTVGEEGQGEGDVVKKDQGIHVINLDVIDMGERSCYHEYTADVKNTNNFAVYDVELQFKIINEKGQILAEFPVGYTKIDSGETIRLKVKNGPEKNGCWVSTKARDYDLSVTYSKTPD